MKTKFESKMIGRDKKSIAKKTEAFEYSVKELNAIATSWQEYFNERFTPDKFLEILSTRNIPYLIKSHYVLTRNNERAKLAQKGEYKLSHLIDETVIPPFGQLKNEIINFRRGLDSRNFSDELESNINRLYNKGKYALPDAIKKEIEEKYTYYTHDQYENEALELVQNVCNSINSINDLGYNITVRDMPLPLISCLEDSHGDKTFGQLKSGNGEKHYSVPHLAPRCTMFMREDDSLARIIKKVSDLNCYEHKDNSMSVSD